MSRGRRHRRVAAVLRGWLRRGEIAGEACLMLEMETGGRMALFEDQLPGDRDLEACLGAYIEAEGLYRGGNP